MLFEIPEEDEVVTEYKERTVSFHIPDQEIANISRKRHNRPSTHVSLPTVTANNGATQMTRCQSYPSFGNVTDIYDDFDLNESGRQSVLEFKENEDSSFHQQCERTATKTPNLLNDCFDSILN